MERILLASTSPRRKELLRSIGVPFRVRAPRVDERSDLPDLPPDQARVLAERKLRAVLADRGALRWVLACDTVVDVDGVVLGKPDDRRQAGGFLRRLAGREHSVHTGIAMFSAAAGSVDVRLATTRVLFRDLAEDEVEWYLRSGEWRGAAGAYRVQSRGALLVASLAGSYSNVVGLPLETFYGMLLTAGYRF
jgi:septum formation protein